jgi:Holliday junction resolvase RusA-like endonuclease
MELFKCIIDVEKHAIKKNSKSIWRNKYTGKPFIATNDKARALINKLEASLLTEKLKARLQTIDCDVNVAMVFYFPTKAYYTKEGKRSSKVADLSNLFEAVSDSLQKVGIMQNDSLICSFDGSGRAAIPEGYKLKIVISKYEA